jgi:hypothetical protein
MKKALISVLICLILGVAVSASATEMTLVDSGICTGVMDHAAAGVGDVFTADIGKLYCFTRVKSPYLEGSDSSVQHVWYYQDNERARITLPVKSSNWGTYSSKIVQPFEIGEWRVEVLDTNGETISVFQFYIKE